MRGEVVVDPTPPEVSQAVLKLSVSNIQIFEGDIISFTVTRSVNPLSNCSVKWSAVTANPADLTGVVSGTLNFASNQTTKNVNVTTVERSGVQGDRDCVIRISEPQSCIISPTYDVMTVTIEDKVIVDPPLPVATRQDLPFNGQFVGVPEMHMAVGEYNIGRGNHEAFYRMVSRRNKPILRIAWHIRLTQPIHIPGTPGSDNQPYRYSSGDGGQMIIEIRRAKAGTTNDPAKCWPDMSDDGLLGTTNINGNPPFTRQLQPQTPGKDYGTGYGRKTNDQRPSYDNFTESEASGGNHEMWRFIEPIPAMAVGTIFFIRWYNVHPNKQNNDAAVNTHYNVPYNQAVNPLTFDKRGPYHGWKDQIWDSTDAGKTLKFYNYGTTPAGFFLVYGEPGDAVTANVDLSKSAIGLEAGGSGSFSEFLRNFSQTIWLRWWITNMPFDMEADRWGMIAFNCDCSQFQVDLQESTGGGAYNTIYQDSAMDVKNLHKSNQELGKQGAAVPWAYYNVKGQRVVNFVQGRDYRTILKVKAGNTAQMREVNRPPKWPGVERRDIFPTLKCHFSSNSGGTWTELSGLRYLPGCWIAPEVDIWTP
jgi:hypothetical protein